MAPTSTTPSLKPLTPSFDPPSPNPAAITSLIAALNLTPHPEGGHFAETDRDPARVPNPFNNKTPKPPNTTTTTAASETRAASTSIFYLLSPASPTGHFHSNRARTVHTLHKGRGRYVVLHPPSASAQATGARARLETFIVGHDVANGERLQWVVEGGVWKGTFLLPDRESEDGDGGSAEGLLISETVVPGFEFEDHAFLTKEGLGRLVGEGLAGELGWLVRREG